MNLILGLKYDGYAVLRLGGQEEPEACSMEPGNMSSSVGGPGGTRGVLNGTR